MEHEILQAIKEDRFYDFIYNNYYKFTPEITRDLLLEIYYAGRYQTFEETKDNIEIFLDQIVESLKQNRDWEE